MSFLSGIKQYATKAFTFLRGNSTASTLVKTAALAYLVYRLNRSANKDNDIDTPANIDAGVRLQIPPATDHKIPVLYGTAFFGGIITDAQQSNNNQTMTFCLTLAETTGHKLSDSSDSAYTFKDVYLNDQRIVFESDGFTVAYTVDRGGNFDRSLAGLVKVYCYAGGSDTPSIPTGYTNASYPNAYSVMPNWGSSTHLMENLVFAVVEINYNREKGSTQLGTWNFEIENDMNKPGDVLYDYMTNTIYGAGIHEDNINQSDLTALNTFSDTGVAYEDQGTGTETLADRYQINGLLDTSRKVMENIEKITSSAGSWLKYDIHEGKWGVVINQSGTSTASFNDSNIIGSVEVSGTGLKELYNSVKVEFPHRDLKDSADFVTVEIATADRNANEEDNTFQLSYDIINEPIQAQLLGLIELKQSRVNLVASFETDFTYINLKAGDLIDLTNSRLGFTNKVFRIITITESQGDTGALTMKITALEYDANVYSTADLYRYTRTDSNGIITIGSIGTPGAPQVTKYEQDSRPRVEVESTAPTGLVEGMEFWKSTDTTLTEANRSYQLIATQRPANGGVYTSGTTVVLDYDALADSEFVIKTRGINSTTVGPFSDVSGLVDFTPVQTTDALDDNTNLSSSTGALLGALTIAELLLKLDSFLGGSVGKTIWQKIKDLFKDTTGIDLDQGDQAFNNVGGSPVVVKDEGTSISQQAASLNFVGNAVTATADANNNVTVTVNTNVYSPGGASPDPGDNLVWDGSDYVPTLKPYAQEKKPEYLTISAFYPPNRANFVDSTGQISADKAWITGSYYVKFGISRTSDSNIGFDGTKFYSALTIGSGNAYLYKSDGTLIDTQAASACTITNNVLEIPFIDRQYKTDYYVLIDEGFVTYCVTDKDINKRYISPAVRGPEKRYVEIINGSPTEVDYQTNWSYSYSHRDGYFTADTPQQFGDEYNAVADNLMMWNFNTPASTVTVTTPSNIDNAPDTPPSGSCNVVSVKFASKIEKVETKKNYTTTNTDENSGAPKTKALETATVNTELTTYTDLFSYIDSIEDYTYDAADTKAPQIAISLRSDLTQVCDTDWLILEFDKEVRVASGDIELVIASDDSAKSTVPANIARVNPNNRRQVIYNRLQTSKIEPSEPMYVRLPANIVYNAEIPDCHWLHGNNAKTTSGLDFTVPDLYLMDFAVTSAVQPDSTKQKVNPQSEIVLYFSKDIKLGTGDIVLKKSDGTTHQTFTVTQTYTSNKVNELFWINNGLSGSYVSSLTLNPTVDMDIDTTYYVTISNTAIKSFCGESFEGVTDTNRIRFKTEPGPTASAATVTNGSPSDTGITAIFDRPVSGSTGVAKIKDSSNNVIASIAGNSSSVSVEDYE
jgi:hypothetical protein